MQVAPVVVVQHATGTTGGYSTSTQKIRCGGGGVLTRYQVIGFTGNAFRKSKDTRKW